METFDQGLKKEIMSPLTEVSLSCAQCLPHDTISRAKCLPHDKSLTTGCKVFIPYWDGHMLLSIQASDRLRGDHLTSFFVRFLYYSKIK